MTKRDFLNIKGLFSWIDRFLFKLPIIGKHIYLRQLSRFVVVGGLSAAINFLILYSFTEWLNVWYLISCILGFIFSAIFNFLVNKFWTFNNLIKGKQAFNQLLRFSVIASSGLLINILIIYSFTEFVGFDYRISWVFACLIVLFWNFGFNKFWTFK
ncbi:GtrA family protein [Patescibacteria group bacterium]|nr:GtrA family protein [Patescibacteria group bacterium]